MSEIVLTENKIENAIMEAIGFGFSLGYLKSIRNFAQKVKYCRKFWGNPIGNGSSRICFQLDDEKILKLAKNSKGLAQNEQEGQEDYYRDSFGIFPKVFYELSDKENYTFIVSEYVLPVKEKDFKYILGIDSDTFYNFLLKTSSSYDEKFSYFRTLLTDEYFEELLENEELSSWYNFMCDYHFSPLDLRNSNFGMTLRDGIPSIVMLDSGLTKEIFKKWYKRYTF